MVSNLVQVAYALITLFLGAAAAFALMTMPGIGVVLGVIAVTMLAVGLAAIGARKIVNMMKGRVAHNHHTT